MEKQKNVYTKSNGKRELEVRQKTDAIVQVVEKPSDARKEVSSNYTKEEGTEPIPTFIVLFSGGKKRERDYFKPIENNKSDFPRIKLEYLDKSDVDIPHDNPKIAIKANEDGFSPDKLLYFAQSWISERYIGEDFELIDSVYLISDVDHFMTELKRIKPLCDAQNLKLIISNSCFEKWLYYGYSKEKPHENTEKRFECPADVTKISRTFKSYCNTLISGGIDPRKALYKLEIAIANAKANYAEDKNGIPLLYSTNMYILGEELLKLIQPELDKKRSEMEISTKKGN